MYIRKEDLIYDSSKRNTKQSNTIKMKVITFKNISVENLRLIDTDTGEDVAQQLIDALPDGVDTIDFKISVKLDDEDTEV